MSTTAIVRFACARASHAPITFRFSKGGGLESVGKLFSSSLSRQVGSPIDAQSAAASFHLLCATYTPPLINKSVEGSEADDTAVDFRYILNDNLISVFEWNAEIPAFSGDKIGLDKYIAVGFGQC
jgi:hypothetical protein